MVNLKNILTNAKLLFKNFYFTTLFFIFIWLAFFDENDFISQIRLTRKLNELRREKVYYETKITEVEQERSEVLGTHKSVEKYARERYLMKKPTEDIYLIKKK